MSMEQLRKRSRGLVADLARNPRNPLVTRFKEKRSLRHPAFDQVTVHRLADELREARRKCRAAKPDALSEVAKRPGQIRSLMDQLKRRSDMRVRHRSKPSAFSGTERFDPAPQPRQKALLSVVRARRVGRDARALTR